VRWEKIFDFRGQFKVIVLKRNFVFVFIFKHGDLEKLINSFRNGTRENFLNANLRLEWSIELFDALAFIHSKQIVHRDLTPSNVYLFTNKSKNNQMSIKIGDFGLSKEKFLSDLKSYVGTIYYQSPEIINNEPYSFKTDVW